MPEIMVRYNDLLLYCEKRHCGLSEWIGANGSRAYAETLLSGFKKYCPNCGARMGGKE